jgi:uncharacterized membrane protein
MLTGIILTVIGFVLLVISLPPLMISPEFTYGYQGGDSQVNQSMSFMMGGIVVLPFGIIFLFRSRGKQYNERRRHA